MKITKQSLKQMIKEELDRVLNEMMGLDDLYLYGGGGKQSKLSGDAHEKAIKDVNKLEKELEALQNKIDDPNIEHLNRDEFAEKDKQIERADLLNQLNPNEYPRVYQSKARRAEQAKTGKSAPFVHEVYK